MAVVIQINRGVVDEFFRGKDGGAMIQALGKNPGKSMRNPEAKGAILQREAPSGRPFLVSSSPIAPTK
jgi:hypothetical protein